MIQEEAAPALAPPPGIVPSLREAVLRWRDRMVGSPRFREWAARFPLTRPIARARARALFDLNAGFVYTQIHLACVRLGVYETLRDGPLTPEALARRVDLPPAGALRLLEAATALRLTAKRGGGRFGLGELGAAMLDNPGVAAMVEHHALLYADLADPVALLRRERGGTGLARYWAYAGADDPGGLGAGQVAEYSALMAASQPMVAAEVLGAYRMDRHRCLLDVGGGEGAFLLQVAARAPMPKLMLFDLPAVAERARTRFAEAGLGERATAFGGSFLADPLPTGADVVSLVRVLHDHDDDAVRAILRAVRAVLPPGGSVLVAEPMAATPGAEPVGEAYFGFYLLAMGRGRPRSVAENTALLREAGFPRVRHMPTRTPLVTSLLVATG